MLFLNRFQARLETIADDKTQPEPCFSVSDDFWVKRDDLSCI
jgi:hypothetical protein